MDEINTLLDALSRIKSEIEKVQPMFADKLLAKKNAATQPSVPPDGDEDDLATGVEPPDEQNPDLAMDQSMAEPESPMEDMAEGGMEEEAPKGNPFDRNALLSKLKKARSSGMPV